MKKKEGGTKEFKLLGGTGTSSWETEFAAVGELLQLADDAVAENHTKRKETNNKETSGEAIDITGQSFKEFE